jgi:flagellar basal-body rod modification protein FlgD
MEISGTTAATAATGTQGVQGGSRQALGKDDFLKLLITQMRYQDPLSPMDNTQFLAQMAQFSSLEQMQNLNESFDQSMLISQSLNNSSAAGFIGRHVRASGDGVTLGTTGSVELGYFLPAEAATVSVTVLDDQGREVRTLAADGTAAGAHRLEWDGADLDGRRVAAGSYTFEVSAKDVDGIDINATSVVTGLVEGITFKNGSAYLLVDGREVPLSEVLEVYQ